MCNLTGIVFEDGLRCFARRSVKKHDSCHVFPKRFSNAGDLLGQDPHADAVMAGAEAEIDLLDCTAFDVF